jgi:dihydropteroate synthase
MGIVNATPDSFSDGGEHASADAGVRRAAELLEAGADLIDIGGESGVTNRPPVTPAEEIERVAPLIARVAGELGAFVSVDTYKPEVARAALDAGAAMVNDFSGRDDPGVLAAVRAAGAALVLTHNPVGPKRQDHERPYDDVAADVAADLGARIERALAAGVGEDQLLLDPGPDLGKSPAHSVAALQDLRPLHALGRPVLLAVSRKDFVGAIVRRRPRDRLAGTLAAVGHGVDAGAHMLRVHDVGAVADYLAVRATLRGERPIAADVRVPEDLRREPLQQPPSPGT